MERLAVSGAPEGRRSSQSQGESSGRGAERLVAMPDADTDLLAEYDRFEREGGVAIVPREVVEVTGPDAGRYLQGQLSQEVVGLPEKGSSWSLLLQPTGKVDAWLRVTRFEPERYLLDVDAGFGDEDGLCIPGKPDSARRCGAEEADAVVIEAVDRRAFGVEHLQADQAR